MKASFSRAPLSLPPTSVPELIVSSLCPLDVLSYPYYIWIYAVSDLTLRSWPSSCQTISGSLSPSSSWLTFRFFQYAFQTKFIPTYYVNSLVAGGSEQKILEQACRDNKIMACIGVSERDHGSLYMAQWTISAEGETISQRRKLKPSIAERLVFGEGDVSLRSEP